MHTLLTDASFSKMIFWLMLLVASGALAADNEGNALVRELQKGGYVVFLRHGSTNHEDKDTDTTNLSNCTTQRNLLPHGREQSKMIGEAFQALKIPVGEVLSSEYCRCADTAKIAFGHATLVPLLSSYMPVPDAEKQRRVQHIRQLLNTPPAASTNTVLVSHHNMFEDASGITLAEGEAAIFKPNTALGFQFIARVRADGWKNVVEQHRASSAP